MVPAPETRVFYHFTPKGNLESILKTGLYPGSEIGKHNKFDGRLQPNPCREHISDYVYLFSNNERTRRYVPLMLLLGAFYGLKKMVTGEKRNLFALPGEYSIVKVWLDENSPVERDYEQMWVFMDRPEKLKERAEVFEKPLPEVITRESLKEYVDSLPENIWETRNNSYRIKETIPPQNLESISWLEAFGRK